MTDFLLTFAAAFAGTFCGTIAVGLVLRRRYRRDESRDRDRALRLADLAAERDRAIIAAADAASDELRMRAKGVQPLNNQVFIARDRRDAAIAVYAAAAKVAQGEANRD